MFSWLKRQKAKPKLFAIVTPYSTLFNVDEAAALEHALQSWRNRSPYREVIRLMTDEELEKHK